MSLKVFVSLIQTMKHFFLLLFVFINNFNLFAQDGCIMDIAGGPVYNQEIFRTVDLKKPSAPSSAFGAQILFKIKGSEEGHSELNIIPAFWQQRFNYKDDIGLFNLRSNSLSLQTEVVLRKPERNINPILGIGIIKTNISGMRWQVNNMKTEFQKVPVALMQQIKDMDRRYHPVVGLGISWVIKAGIRQLDISGKVLVPLKDYIAKPTTILPWINYGYPVKAMDINTTPTYANISVNYYYSRVKNWSFRRK
jgi:hypothetical protein